MNETATTTVTTTDLTNVINRLAEIYKQEREALDEIANLLGTLNMPVKIESIKWLAKELSEKE